MIDENEEFEDVMEVIKKRYPEEKCKNPRWKKRVREI